MKKNLLKTMCVTLCVCLLILSSPTTALSYLSEIQLPKAETFSAQSAATAATSGKCGANVTYTISDDGILTLKGTGSTYDYSITGKNDMPTYPWYNKGVESIVIGDGITVIGEYLFTQLSITSLTVPDGVIEIKRGAFAECNSLTTISLPNSLEDIGAYAFAACPALKTVTIPGSVKNIGEYAFYANDFESVIIGNGVSVIPEYTFAFCSNLKFITIPNSILSIKDNAFNLFNDVTTVYYDGTEHEWSNIEIGADNERLTNANITFRPVNNSISGLISGVGNIEDILIQIVDENGNVIGTANIENGKYSFDDIEKGAYILKISKQNYTNRSYKFNSEENMILDVQLNLTGDINGDGKINAKDKKMMFNHIDGNEILIDYPFDVGDINGDGEINTKDKKLIYNYISNGIFAT